MRQLRVDDATGCLLPPRAAFLCSCTVTWPTALPFCALVLFFSWRLRTPPLPRPPRRDHFAKGEGEGKRNPFAGSGGTPYAADVLPGNALAGGKGKSKSKGFGSGKGKSSPGAGG